MSKSREVRVPGCLVGLSSGFAGSCPIDTGGEIPLPNGDTLIMGPRMAEFDVGYSEPSHGIIFSLKSGCESNAYLYNASGKMVFQSSFGMFYDMPENELYGEGINIHLYCYKDGSIYDGVQSFRESNSKQLTHGVIYKYGWIDEYPIASGLGLTCYVITQHGGKWKVTVEDTNKCSIEYGGEIRLPNGDTLIMEPKMSISLSECTDDFTSRGLTFSLRSGCESLSYIYDARGSLLGQSRYGSFYDLDSQNENTYYAQGNTIHLYCLDAGVNEVLYSHNLYNEDFDWEWWEEYIFGIKCGIPCYTIVQHGKWWELVNTQACPVDGGGQISLPNGEVLAIGGKNMLLNKRDIAEDPGYYKLYGAMLSTLSGREYACFLSNPSGQTLSTTIGTIYKDKENSEQAGLSLYQVGSTLRVWFSRDGFYVDGGWKPPYDEIEWNNNDDNFLKNLLGKVDGLVYYTISLEPNRWVYMHEVTLGNGEVISLTEPIPLSDIYGMDETGIYFTRSSGRYSLAFYEGAGINLGYKQETGYNYFGNLFSCSEGDTIYFYDIGQDEDAYIKVEELVGNLQERDSVHENVPMLCTLRREGGKWILAEDNSI